MEGFVFYYPKFSLSQVKCAFFHWLDFICMIDLYNG